MKIFLDANVLISVLNKEYPLFPYSSRVLSLVDYPNKYKVYTSPLCLAIAFYFAEKKSGAEQARKKIDLLAEKLSFTTMNENTVLLVSRNKKILDMEDGLQYYSAKESGCECIITENADDFYFSDIEIIGSRSFLENHVF